MRWQERRVEDELLKRELLLRLQAERSGTPGRSGPPTGYFRRRVRLLLLRHPLFALRYYRLANERRLRRRQRRLSPRFARMRRVGVSAVAALVSELGRGRRSLSARLVRLGRACGSAINGVVQEVGGQRRRLRRVWGTALAVLVSELRLQRRSFSLRLLRVRWACRSAFVRLVAAGRRQRRRLYALLVGVQRSCGATLAGVAAELRRQRLVLPARLVRIGAGTRAAAGRIAVPLRATELGLGRFDRWRGTARNRRTWAVGAMLAAVVLAAAAATAVVTARDFASRAKTDVAASAKPQPAHRIADEPWHPPRALSTPAASAPAGPRAPKRAGPAARPARRVRPTAVQHTILVSNTVQTATAPTAPAGSGPAPLPAPPGASAPSPLKAPHR